MTSKISPRKVELLDDLEVVRAWRKRSQSKHAKAALNKLCYLLIMASNGY